MSEFHMVFGIAKKFGGLGIICVPEKAPATYPTTKIYGLIKVVSLIMLLPRVSSHELIVGGKLERAMLSPWLATTDMCKAPFTRTL